MAELATANNLAVAAPRDSTEVLQRILEVEQDMPVSYEEAYDIGQSLISLCGALITTDELAEQSDGHG